VLWIVQLVPSHRSASVGWAPVLSVYPPTAVQALAAVQDTSIKRTADALAGAAVGWTVHPVPSQLSANVAPLDDAVL
jgi:hypothetical protein